MHWELAPKRKEREREREKYVPKWMNRYYVHVDEIKMKSCIMKNLLVDGSS
jgi:hypothetical protein